MLPNRVILVADLSIAKVLFFKFRFFLAGRNDKEEQ
jgi:hypothetical protein